MDHGGGILLGLFVIFVAAQIGAEIAQRLKLPGVVGEIVAGCALGPSALGWIQPSEALDLLAEIGVVLLLFSVGLETKLEEMKRVGRSAFFVGVLGVVVPFVLGSLWARGSGFEWAVDVRRGCFRRHVGRDHGARAAGTRRVAAPGKSRHPGRRRDR